MPTEENYLVPQMEQRVYSLVQCTPDLSAGQCDQCLLGVMDYLLSCCSTRQGARVLFPSCSFRYEFYPFNAAEPGVEAPAPTPLPPLPPLPPSQHTTKGNYWLTMSLHIKLSNIWLFRLSTRVSFTRRGTKA